jgi:hypothetical protein
MQNYTHIENLATASPRRGPQVMDNQESSTTGGDPVDYAPLTGKQHQQQQQEQIEIHREQYSSALFQKVIGIEA